MNYLTDFITREASMMKDFIEGKPQGRLAHPSMVKELESRNERGVCARTMF